MNKKTWIRKCRFLLMMCAFLFLSTKNTYASDMSENINVTVPTDISIIFNEDGTNSINEFKIENGMPVPITIESIHVTENNEWELVSEGTTILLDSKKMIFKVEGSDLQNGNNTFDIIVPKNSEKIIDLEVDRGAWTTSKNKENAFTLQVEYALGKEDFQVSFDSNGGNESYDPITVKNGDIINLPLPTRVGFDFMGWEDESGEIFTGVYTMPVKNVVFTARWEQTESTAYAVYSEDDYSLVFTRSKREISVGETYNEKIVTNVYTGFEENEYASGSEVPWYEYRSLIKTVSVMDTIKPISTQFWFYNFDNATTLDLGKLDTSDVQSMKGMLQGVGKNAQKITVNGLSEWNTSSVKNMSSMFSNLGTTKATICYIGDLGPKTVYKEDGTSYTAWDTSSVEDMSSMFSNVGRQKARTLTLSGLNEWDTSSVKTMASMFFGFQRNGSTDIVDVSKWNTSSVIDMSNMFNSSWSAAKTWNVGDFSTKTVKRADGTSYIAWDTSSVEDMQKMFYMGASSADVFYLTGIDSWDTSSVKDMNHMFYAAGNAAETWNLDLGDWDTSSVISMRNMFSGAGETATSFNLNGVEKWDTSSVENMYGMFMEAGLAATYSIDCSGWNVALVTSYDRFNYQVEEKVIMPNFL